MHMHGTLVVRACVYAGFYGLVCVLVDCVHSLFPDQVN